VLTKKMIWKLKIWCCRWPYTFGGDENYIIKFAQKPEKAKKRGRLFFIHNIFLIILKLDRKRGHFWGHFWGLFFPFKTGWRGEVRYPKKREFSYRFSSCFLKSDEILHFCCFSYFFGKWGCLKMNVFFDAIKWGIVKKGSKSTCIKMVKNRVFQWFQWFQWFRVMLNWRYDVLCYIIFMLTMITYDNLWRWWW
jgi:hypothetical protein